MEATLEGTPSQNGVDRLRNSATPQPGQNTAGAHFQQLFDDVEDLIKRVADIESPEIQKIRAKVRVAMMLAKSAVEDGAVQMRRQARQAAHTSGRLPARLSLAGARARHAARFRRRSARWAKVTDGSGKKTLSEASYLV